MVEVLDHYHGPHARKLWLIAWAEKANDGSRTGYCKREVLAARLGRSPSRVSHIAYELEAEGTIKRLGGGVWGKATVYELLPLDTAQVAAGQLPAQGAAGQLPMDTAQGAARQLPTGDAGQLPMSATGQLPMSAPATHPIPDNPDKPSSSSPRTPRTGSKRRAAATADDDFNSICHKLGATGPERDLIRSMLGAQTVIRDHNAYLRQHLDSDGGESFMRHVRRLAVEADAEPAGQDDDDGGEFPF